MSLPAISALKFSMPSSMISMVTLHHLAPLYENIPEIHSIITIPPKPGIKSLRELKTKLITLKIQKGVLFTNSFHSALLLRLAGISNLTGYIKDARGFLLKNKRPFPANETQHYIDFYLDIAELFIESETGKKADIDRSRFSNHLIMAQDEQDQIESYLTSLGIDLNRPIITISPTAAYGTAKTWLPERFSNLIEKLQTGLPGPVPSVLLLGTAGENKKIGEILHPVRGMNSVYNMAGKLTLRQAILTVAMSMVFIGNDSGMMHVASSVNVPSVVLFGPTPPGKSIPRHENVRILFHKVKCSPCKYRECPIDHACMAAITVEEVFDAITRFYNVSVDENVKLKREKPV